MSSNTILIADDDAAIRTVLTQALGRVGYEVKAAGNAATLWSWVSNGDGDLVITDVVMPDGNGLDLVSRIRKIRPELKIIVMSAQNTLMTALRATERGAFEYLPKPFDLNELLSIVKKALETGLLEYQGSPDSLREYIHVEDAARASVAALSDDFCNQSVVLTGQEPMRVLDMLEMLAEILGLRDAVKFIPGEQLGHYIRTPYAYQPKLGRKYVPPVHVDLGQGLIQLIDEVRSASVRA